MEKISKKNTKRYGSKTSTSHYARVRRVPLDDAALDVAIEKRLDHGTARRKIERLHRRLITALGEKARAFLDLNSLMEDMHVEREEAYFNAGYEHGRAEGTAAARRGKTRLSLEAKELATELRERIVQAGLPPRQATLSLLECMWAVVVSHNADRTG